MSLYDKHIKILSGLTDVFGFNPVDVEQGSIDWGIMRLGVLSASKADKIVAGVKTDGRATYMSELISGIINCTPPDNGSFKQTEWGHLYEPVARDALSVALGYVEIKEIPFMYKDKTMRCGVSPDGLFDDVICEIKAPYDGTHHVKHMSFDVTKSEWEWQRQFQLYAADANEHIFCTYDPRVVLGKNLHYTRNEKDDKRQATLADAVPQFIADLDKALASIGVEFGQHWQFIKQQRVIKND
jgi:hypothetical protein